MKKAVSFLLVLCMIASLAACGQKAQEELIQTPAETAALAETVKSIDGKFEVPITVKVGLGEQETYQGNESSTDNAWIDLYKEHGINLDIMYVVPGTEGNEKLSQMIMSGNYPDVFNVSLEDYVDYVKQGVIADITDYYDDYLSDASKEYLAYDGGDSVKRATIDGRIYGIPQMASSTDQVSVLWIRKDWLNNLGLDMPETAEEVAEVAKAFTFNDPDGNGQDDTYGFAVNGMDITDACGGIAHVMNMFGTMPRQLRFIEENGEIIWAGQDKEKMISGLTWLSDLYAQGCVPKDFVTSDANKLRADFASGKYGMVVAPMWWLMDYLADALKYNPDADFAALPIPGSEANPDGSVYFPSATISFWVLSSKCEHPEALFKLFNMSVDYIVNNKDRTTEEYEKYAAGKSGMYTGKSLAVIPYLDDPADNYNNYLQESKAIATGNTDGLTPMQKTHYESEKFFLENKEKLAELSGEDWSQFGIGASYYSVFGFEEAGYGALHKMVEADKWKKEAFLSMPDQEMLNANANLAAMTSETIVKIVMGQQEPESYGEFLEQWKSKGGDTILKKVNEWYQENK